MDLLTLYSPFLCFLCLCELRYGLFHGIVCYMNIAVHGGRDTGMTQQLLQDFGLHSALNSTGSVCMAQSVHTESLDSCIIAQLVEVSVV